MPPGGAAIRSATSRWSMSTKRSGRGSSPSTWWSTGLVMWYGRLATRSQGALDEVVQGDVEDVALDAAEASGSSAKRSAQVGGQPSVDLDGGDLGAGREQRRR